MAGQSAGASDTEAIGAFLGEFNLNGSYIKESGITIHHVTKEVDGGEIIFQATCEVKPNDTTETLASRIHLLEHKHYPLVIEQLLK